MSESILPVPTMFPERRQPLERREFTWSSMRPLMPAFRRGLVFLLIGLVPMALMAWQWRIVRYAPLWLARAHWADRSDLYQGSTNGIPNATLVMQARSYVTDIDHMDASGNMSAPESLRASGVHIDLSWFKRHAPDSVEFNPFLSHEGRFVVAWLYVPGAQKAVWKSPRADTDWYTLRGEPAYPACRVSIVMAPDQRFIGIALNPVQS